MKARVFNPRKLHVEAFANDAAMLQGEWPAQDLSRLADAAAPEAPASEWPPVRWVLRGEKREQSRADSQVWLKLEAEAAVSLTCQRCLQPVQEHLQLSNWLRFARDEDEAAILDADSEEDVLALTRSLDTLELIEDELLLALPLVPRHQLCPQPLPRPMAELAEQGGDEEERPNPFAALAALKGRGPTQ